MSNLDKIEWKGKGCSLEINRDISSRFVTSAIDA